jgi:DNA-binding GntR family transcriptional regulator
MVDTLITDRVYKTIRNQIITGRLKPREKLTTARLAEMIGVSRTPIRGALEKLALEGLVELIPHSGASVSDILSDDLEELYLMRSVLEGLAVRLAVEHLTEEDIRHFEYIMEEYRLAMEQKDIKSVVRYNEEFHLSIATACKKPRLINEIKKLYDYCLRYRSLYIGEHTKLEVSYKSHLEILDVIKRRDPELAEKAVRAHLSKAPTYIYDALKNIERDNQ